jgi:hypothetical protein
MTVSSIQAGAHASLFGREGELISVRISVEPRLLEDLLEALAALDFPVNPELNHPEANHPETNHHPAEVTVEFPAYSARIDEIRDALRKGGFNAGGLEIRRVLGRAAGT